MATAAAQLTVEKPGRAVKPKRGDGGQSASRSFHTDDDTTFDLMLAELDRRLYDVERHTDRLMAQPS
jgi:hypothetical protein